MMIRIMIVIRMMMMMIVIRMMMRRIRMMVVMRVPSPDPVPPAIE